MKHPSPSAFLTFVVMGYTRAYQRDGLSALHLNIEDEESSQGAREFTFVDRDPIDRVHIVLEETATNTTTDDNDLEWTSPIDAQHRNTNLEYRFDGAPDIDEQSGHVYGSERESIHLESLMQRPHPPYTKDEIEFIGSRKNMADHFADEEERNGSPILILDESQINRQAATTRLRRRNTATVEMGPSSVEKEHLRDSTVPLFQPTTNESGEFDLMPYAEPAYQVEQPLYEDGRILQNNCSPGQKFIKIEILTDNSGFETSWMIREANGALVIAGPPQGTQYDDNASYTGGICLDAGSYTFTVYDKFGDGMCGSNSGQGLYRFYLDGVEKFTSPSSCGGWAQRDHSFTIASNSAPNPSRTSPTAFQASSRSGCHNVKIQFKVDKYPKETTVLFHKNGLMALESRNEVAAYGTKSMEACVSAGTYTFKLIDVDGICCQSGNGWYKLSIDGTPVISGGYFVGSKSYTVKVGHNWRSTMDSRDQEWLKAHNDRRRIYNGGEGYVPLRWSQSLAYDAKRYAEVLKIKYADCVLTKHSHDPNTESGENLASNVGSGSWGALRSAEQVMFRWVDKEVNLAYPSNAHYLQVVWRATQYVGCGESVRYFSDGQICRIQVCRYERPGSCGVRNGNWRAEAWKDDALCGSSCPNEGCYV